MGRKTSGSYYSKPIERIHADFKGICAECGEYVELVDASRDHIFPRSKGGGNNRENIQLMHKKCNNLKQDEIYPADWKQQLKGPLVLAKGYRCSYCLQEITALHKKNDMVSRTIKRGKIIALHTWCNKERIKYGRF